MGPVAAVAAIAMAVVGSIASGLNQAATAEEEARLRDLQANEVSLKALRDEQILRKRGRAFQGDQGSAISAGGANIEGTPLLLLEDTAYSIEEQAMTIRHQAQFRAAQLRSGAESLRAQATSARVAGFLGAGTNILTSAGKMGSDANEPRQSVPTFENRTTGGGYIDYFRPSGDTQYA